MTTAHRPTWNAARGGSEQGGNLLVNPTRAYSALDLPAHTKLKYRTNGKPGMQDADEFKTKLEDKERAESVLGKRV